MKIKGCNAMVIGGGSGMGAAVSRYLAEQHAKVIIVDKSNNAAVQIAQQIQGQAVCCDITQAQALEAFFASLDSPLSIAINCAGVAPAKRMVGKDGPVSLEWFEQVIQTNLVGTFNVMRLAADAMMKNPPNDEGERGVIINTASIAAFEGQIGQTAYSASKGGVVAMTLPAARELAKFGIRVMAIAPGFIDTPMIQGMPQEVRTALEAQTLFPKRLGRAEEFAQLAGHIVTNPLLNGEVIRLDGGVRMRG